MKRKTRLAIVVSHPIQHFVSFYRALALDPEIELRVIFNSRIGVNAYYDTEMRSEISWKMDMLGGYAHEFLVEGEPTSQPGFFAMNSAALTGRLAAFAPDAVLVYGYAQMNALRALLWCRRKRIPAIIISDSERLKTRSGWKSSAKSLIIPRIFGLCSAYLSVGDQNEDYYRHYGARSDRIFRSPFTIDEAHYRDAAARRAELRAEVRGELGLSEADRVILFVGKLSERKRPGDLLDAIAHLAKDEGAAYHAVFAGNGELAETLKAKTDAQSLNAHFAGFVNVDRLPALYAAADILVHPSQADPHPLVCSEAACIGVPVILSDRIGAAGPTDIARPGENALIYPCSDSFALAGAIRDIAENPARLAAMSVRAKAIFDELDVRRSVRGLKEALEAVGE